MVIRAAKTTQVAEDNAAPVPAAAANMAEASMQGRRISKSNAKRLHNYFSSAGFQCNTRMPAAGRDPRLDSMIKQMKLSRRQVSYQIQCWKLTKFDGMDLVINVSDEEVREAIIDRLSQSPEDFADDVLFHIGEVMKEGDYSDIYCELVDWFKVLATNSRYAAAIEELYLLPPDSPPRLLLSKQVHVLLHGYGGGHLPQVGKDA